jgi:phosphomannomutase/phosphomannomutase/phosphoglucomutase
MTAEKALSELTCFKAYDIRGRVPDELDEALARRIGRAYAELLSPRRVVVGRDVRLSSPALCAALADGLCDGGADVHDIGLCGTEEVYFATFAEGMDGGIMVTASHNPRDYNGLKLVREGARPISGDSGLFALRDLAAAGNSTPAATPGTVWPLDTRGKYVQHLLGYIDPARLRPLKVVANAGNGCAGPVLERLAARLPLTFVTLHPEPPGVRAPRRGWRRGSLGGVDWECRWESCRPARGGF